MGNVEMCGCISAREHTLYYSTYAFANQEAEMTRCSLVGFVENIFGGLCSAITLCPYQRAHYYYTISTTISQSSLYY